MTTTRLAIRGLVYYWRTNLAVVAGVATAVAVLAGALLVGESVRGSLRDLALQRLGRTAVVIASPGFFRRVLAEDLQQRPAFGARFTGAAPLIAVAGAVTDQDSSRRAGDVRVYGVDDRFWQFHGRSGVAVPGRGEALISPALAAETGARPGGAILVRVQRPSDMPLESIHGRKADLGRTVRVTVRDLLPASDMGEFSLEANQTRVRAVFLPLAALQQALEIGDRVNTVLVAGSAGNDDEEARAALEELVRREARLEDVGVTVRAVDSPRVVSIGSDAGLLDSRSADAALRAVAALGAVAQPVFTYLANTIQANGREIPYSLVAATDLGAIAPGLGSTVGQSPPPVVLNEWAAQQLNAGRGDAVTLDYYVWEEPGRLATRSAAFRVAAVVPIAAGDADLAPVYPGISDSPTLTDWDPPFPVDLRRIRPADEAYWERHRTTPKAFIPLDAGQQLWRSRYGQLTSIRVPVAADQPIAAVQQRVTDQLRAAIDPLDFGLAVRSVRSEAVAASRGATDFGEYFLYFSSFLVVSALLLAALFFKLGIEQRSREVGLLRAVGFSPAAVRRLFLAEGAGLAACGSVLGVLGAIGYASLLMVGLRTWWVDAVGTTALTLHVTPLSLGAGAVGGVAAALACIWWTLRSLGRVSERALLAGEVLTDTPSGRSAAPRLFGSAATGFALVGLALIAGGAAGFVPGAAAFFGAGTALLVSMLCAFSAAIRRPARGILAGHGWSAVSRLGMRSTSYRPGRAVLSVAVIASATFILIAVDAFRRGGSAGESDRHAGTGGYPLVVESLLPVVHDPNTPEGRDNLNLFDLDPAVAFEPFRLLPGDDASCLNLYEPRNPRILAPRDSFIAQGRFSFQSSQAATDAERANPWLLLQRAQPDGAIPVIADANSMTYVLHRRLGEELTITRGNREIRLRFVAALRDSIFQRELLMSEASFLELFPDIEGYRVMLVDAPAGGGPAIASTLEDRLADFGADAVDTAQRLAEFHRVENTYLSTFQALGGLGLLLGTLGLATVLLRNVLERRRELALLAAVGFERRHFAIMVFAENVMLLAIGVFGGALCAALATAPAIAERGGRLPLSAGGGWLVVAVLVAGVLSSLLAVAAATRAPLLESLHAE